MNRNTSDRYIATKFAVISVVLLLSACTAPEVPELSMNNARESILNAEEDAAKARSDAEAAQQSSSQQAAEYQRQIDALEARPTDRGLVLTLGDVLFATGSAELQGGTDNNLYRLVTFLKQYPERNVQVEGHTDNVGSEQLNQQLSKQRADSVQKFLTEQGVDSQRIKTSGLSMDKPVSSNDTAAGRQQNRRVEIIIDDPANQQ
ncbi:MAG: OmpA family protein [Natronospirillum sp.]